MKTLPRINRRLRLGTRGSLLARMQSQHVADLLERFHLGLEVELVICSTSGDAFTGRSMADVGGKGLFTKELEEALLDGRIDFAVHSMKDVPVTMPLVDQSDLIIAAVPEREDPRDVLVSIGASELRELPIRARVGTSSLRRRCQLLAKRPDLVIDELRGNIDTRLKSIRQGRFDAIVLAAAGLRRSGMYDDRLVRPLAESDVLPAAGQGALALQCRRDDVRTRRLLSVLDHWATRECVELERALVAALNGDCHSPIAAQAHEFGGLIELRAAVGSRGGLPPVFRARARGARNRSVTVVEAVVEQLCERGAMRWLHGHSHVLREHQPIATIASEEEQKVDHVLIA
jgi:hydroxymethylbilane synthase